MLWYSLEAPQRGTSNEYPRFCEELKKKKKKKTLRPLLPGAMLDAVATKKILEPIK